jgi:chromate reductase
LAEWPKGSVAEGTEEEEDRTMREVRDEIRHPIRVVAIAGSLRRGSLNRKMLEAARTLAPDVMEIEILDLNDVPMYNGDLETEQDRPEAVVRLKQAIASADALLISTPEYNHSIPGVLQNAIDWASRPNGKSPLAGKPLGILGVSPGSVGAARAQQQLKVVLMATLALVLPHGGVSIGLANEKLDASGKLVHEPTRQFLASYLRDLAAWTLRLQGRSEGVRQAA